MQLTERAHIVQIIAETTEIGESTNSYYSRNIDCSAYHDLDVIVALGKCGGSGILWVEKCPTTTASSAGGTVVNCYTSRRASAGSTQNSTGGGDSFGAITAGSTAGTAYVIASSNHMHVLSITLDAFGTAQACRIMVQGGTQTSGSAYAVLSNPRYAANTQVSVLSDYTTL